MTTRRLLTLMAGVVLLVAALVFPPWKFTLSVPLFPQLRIERPGPYAFVFAPPEIPGELSDIDLTGPHTVEDIFRRYAPDHALFHGYERVYWSAHIDLPRLLLPVGAISVVTFGLIICFREKRSA